MPREKRPALPPAYGTPGNKPPPYVLGEVTGTPETASDYSFATVNTATPISRAASSPPTTIERSGIDSALMTVVNAEAARLFGLSAGPVRAMSDISAGPVRGMSDTSTGPVRGMSDISTGPVRGMSDISAGPVHVDAASPSQTPSDKENAAPLPPSSQDSKSAPRPSNFLHRGNKMSAFFSKAVEAPNSPCPMAPATVGATKRSADDAGLEAEDGSGKPDAEVNGMRPATALKNNSSKQGRKPSAKPAQKPQQKPVRKSARPISKAPPRKRQKVVQDKAQNDLDGPASDDIEMTDVEEGAVDAHNTISTNKDKNAANMEAGAGEANKTASKKAGKTPATAECDEDHVLVLQTMKRSERILNPEDPDDAALIAEAMKHKDTTLYDTDDEREGDLKGNISKPQLFRNVRWKDITYDTEVEPFEPTLDFNGFVPGRFERMPDGTVRDQKTKLLTKLIDANGSRKIYRNPPPKDWNNQEALTALNKRIVQQIRRNSNVRFRRQVVPYEQFEREWILKNLNSSGKPKKGWIEFVADFNDQFEGKVFEGLEEPRPQRSVSSLTKEVDRFRNDYVQGRVPEPATENEKRKAASGKRKASNNIAHGEGATASKKRKAGSEDTVGPATTSKKRKTTN